MSNAQTLPLSRKLGANPADQRKLRRCLPMNLYLIASQLPSPPDEMTAWLDAMTWPSGAMLNTTYGCCTCSAKGHAVQLWTANTGTEYTVADDSILDMYVSVTGEEGAAFDPTTGANDNGATVIDSLDYMRNVGLEGHKIEAYLGFSVQSQMALKYAVSLFGCADTGLALPAGSQQQTVWDVPAHVRFRDRHLWTPGSWGGHDALIGGYNATGPIFISWGEKVQATWAWWMAYGQEAYAPYSPSWVNSDKGISPSQLDTTTLMRDLQLVAQTP